MLTVWIIAGLVFYCLLGFILTFSGAFDRRQTNPVQDYIHWMKPLSITLLWPFLLLTWQLSALFNRTRWPEYISHEVRMEALIDEEVAGIDQRMPNAGMISYGIPSPRVYRKQGLRAAHITVELE